MQSNVAVCILTYMRTQELARLLDALVNVELVEGVETTVIVVDNDIAGSAGSVVESKCLSLPLPVKYCVEPQPGIPHARNRALREALGATWVVFIDDDETPSPGWLRALLNTARAYSADIVMGPIVTLFDASAPQWLRSADLEVYNRQRFPTGTALSSAATNNVLISAEIIANSGASFDPAYAATGGSDTAFFMRLLSDGARAVYCNEALVYEHMPPRRSTARWALARAFRLNNTYTRVVMAHDPSSRQVLKRIARSGGRIARGVASLPLVVFRGRAALLRASADVAYGLGGICSIVGLKYREYERTRGPGH